MQAESSEKKVFSKYITYIDKLLYTDYQNINQCTKYICYIHCYMVHRLA